MSETAKESHFSSPNVVKINSFHCFGLWNIRTKRLQTEKVFLIVDILLLNRLNPTSVFWPRLQCLPFYYTTSVIHFQFQ